MVLPKAFIVRVGKNYLPNWELPDEHGKIEILQKGSQGGQATVCKVKTASPPSTEYALKVYTRKFTGSGVKRQMEIEYRAKFDHPSFVKPVNRGQVSSNRKAILFPWIDGKTLVEYMGSQSPSDAHKVELMIEIVEAIAYLHDNGWLHNDLKASNIMVADSTDHPIIRIIDFALAAEENSKDLEFPNNHELAGLAEWVAPELHKQPRKEGGIQNATQKSDVWAIGCLLLYILTGKTLWDYLNFEKSFNSRDFLDYCNPKWIAQNPISDFQIGTSTISDPLREILMQCLNVDRKQRPPAKDVVEKLRLLR